MKESLINSSFKYCEDITRKHYENFPVASLLLPKDKRRYIFSIYAFARAADDFADEPGIEGGAEKRLALLEEWRLKLEDCYNGKAYDPIFIALGKTVADCKIPIETLENLLKAFKQDVVKSRYATFDEVLGYCENSANPVGRLVLMVFGRQDEEMFYYSDKICTALQLTNFWQDIVIDLEKNRVYLPEEDIIRFGYSYDRLFEKKFDNSFKELLKFEVNRTRDLFNKGKKLIELTENNKASKKLSKELRLTLTGGNMILDKIEELGYNTLTYRPVISKFEKIKLFLRTRI
jgi:hydroxysqualene synthase